jgi:hypothetical protein
MLGACYALAVQTLQAQRSGPEIINESETAGPDFGDCDGETTSRPLHWWRQAVLSTEFLTYWPVLRT